MNIHTMAREGLQRDLTIALRRAVALQETVRRLGLRVETNGELRRIDLTVHPEQAIGDGGLLTVVYLIVFEAAAPTTPKPAVAETTVPEAESATETSTAAALQSGDVGALRARILELERELELGSNDEYLLSMREEMETANEELKSSNEELQAVNEQLNSSNEELQSVNEELQSMNEELAIVNAESRTEVADLSRANNDMNNLLSGTGIATLFVDEALRITRFTPTMTLLIKLIPSDIGRPVGDIVCNLVDDGALADEIQAVLSDLLPREREVQTRQGAWFLMRIAPYRTLENVIEGAVITFVDISDRKRSEEAVRAARAFAEAIVDTVREGLVVLDAELRVISVNRAFHRRFGLSDADIRGQPLATLAHLGWDITALRERLRALQTSGGRFDAVALEQDVPGSGLRRLRLNARRIDCREGQPEALLLAFEDTEPSLVQAAADADPGRP
jgi:two-component system CheB/CheR fusion protein